MSIVMGKKYFLKSNSISWPRYYSKGPGPADSWVHPSHPGPVHTSPPGFTPTTQGLPTAAQKKHSPLSPRPVVGEDALGCGIDQA